MKALIFKNSLAFNFILSVLLLSIGAYSYGDYSPQIINPADGYKIKLYAYSAIAQTPIIGSDGKPYYKVGNDIAINSNAASSSGSVKCVGKVWGTSGYQHISYKNAYHRLFNYTPPAGFTLNNRPVYRVNNNVVMTVQSNISNWTNIPGGACADLETSSRAEDVSVFEVQFPITFTFYINEKIIDGQIMIAAMDLAGYVRAFVQPLAQPTFNSWHINEATAPVRLEASQLNVNSSCTTSTSTGQVGTVNLRHGQLNTLKYDNKVTEKVNYTCKFSTLTKVRLRLDYAQDGDPQKRLPLVNKVTKEKIYTTLMMTDDTTGQSGLDMNVDIQNLKTISISSHLQGTNAPAGDYQGSAWLIATFI